MPPPGPPLVKTNIVSKDFIASTNWIKNSGIARALYPFLGASPMGDLDVLVDKTDFRNAHQILLDYGYLMKFRSPLEEDNLDSAEQI